MKDNDDSLVMRRPKRSTAGNRMEAALAEFHADDMGQDVEEDIDFVIEKDEEDAFESDFESTDEEGAQEDVDAAAEKMVREEEKRTKRTARSQLDKVTAAAHARQKLTFNPQAQREKAPAKPKRRVSFAVIIDETTGEIKESGRQRHSRRTHTMLNTSETVSRMKDAEEKKSALPRKVKTKARAPTQDELIARALDMEEGNIKEHRNYLSLEEEKRKRARLVRTTVQGPLLRWISKLEDIKVVEYPTPPPPPTPASVPQSPSPATAAHMQYMYPYPGAQASNVPVTGPSGSYSSAPYLHPSSSSAPYYAYQQSAPTAQTPALSPNTAGRSVTQPPNPFVFHTFPQWPLQSAPQTTTAVVPPSQPPPPPAPPEREPIERIEKVSKCYVIHEAKQEEGAAKPLWKDTMAAMFGDHVKWEEMKVFSGKGRPLSRPIQSCPISGQPARYLDPRTAVPFANVEAYQTLSKILGHEYAWSDSLGCYTAYEGSQVTTSGGSKKRRKNTTNG